MKSMFIAAVAAASLFAGAAFADDLPGRNNPHLKMLQEATIVISNDETGSRIATVKEDGTFTMVMPDGTMKTGDVVMADDELCLGAAKRGVESQRGSESICFPVSSLKPGAVVEVDNEMVTFVGMSMSDLPGRRNPNN